MNELKRVLRAPSAILWAVALLLLPAWILGTAVRRAVSDGVEGYFEAGTGRYLPGLVELMAEGGMLSAFGMLGPVLLGIALILWVVGLGGVVLRLRDRASLASMAMAGVASVPGLVAVTFWHLLVRALLVGVPFSVAGRLDGLAQVPVLLIAAGLLCFSTCALDFARCRVVLLSESGLHPRTLWRSLQDPLSTPSALARSALWTVLQWACLVAVAWMILHRVGVGEPILWMRGAAVLGLLFGLARLAVAVEHLRADSEPATEPTVVPAEEDPVVEEPADPRSLEEDPTEPETVEPETVEPETAEPENEGAEPEEDPEETEPEEAEPQEKDRP